VCPRRKSGSMTLRDGPRRPRGGRRVRSQEPRSHARLDVRVTLDAAGWPGFGPLECKPRRSVRRRGSREARARTGSQRRRRQAVAVAVACHGRAAAGEGGPCMGHWPESGPPARAGGCSEPTRFHGPPSRHGRCMRFGACVERRFATSRNAGRARPLGWTHGDGSRSVSACGSLRPRARRCGRARVTSESALIQEASSVGLRRSVTATMTTLSRRLVLDHERIRMNHSSKNVRLIWA
jgi:hypothetical protein